MLFKTKSKVNMNSDPHSYKKALYNINQIRVYVCVCAIESDNI